MKNYSLVNGKCYWMVVIAVVLLSASQDLYGQDSLVNRYGAISSQYASAVNKKLASFNCSIENYTNKSLEKYIQQEKKMQKKVGRIDSIKARLLFAYSIDSLKRFQALIKGKNNLLSKVIHGDYFSYADTLKQSLAFMNKMQERLDKAGQVKERLSSSLASFDQMEARLATVDKLNEFIKQRIGVLQSQLTTFPALAGNLKKINQEAAYYKMQINEYKNTLKDPEKIEKLAITALKKLPAFQDYMQKNSQLATLFASPSSVSGIGSLTSPSPVNGLPSRAAVQQLIQGQLPASVLNVEKLVQQQTGIAQSELDNLKNKLDQKGGMQGKDMPDNQPNSQKSKSFGRRLEYGVNAQFARNTTLFPATGNFGLQIGYKLNDKSCIGIGASYRMGLGTGWNHIQFTNEAVGVRTYLKWKMKHSFFIQGGGEWNYLTRFSSVAQLKDLSAWQASALAGIGKEYKIRGKLNGDIQVLYDFLYSRHIPVSQPVMFRVGYNF